MSDAYRALDQRLLRGWRWDATAVLLVSHDWDPVRHGAEALAGRRLATALLEAGARVHVLSEGRADEELQHRQYSITSVASRPFARCKVARAVQMIRSTIPESAGQWVPGAVAAGLGILSTMPANTMIYGRASPGSSNIVAWHLARMTGRPWVAHFSDEWPPVHLVANGKKWLAPYKWPLFTMWRQRIVRDAGALTFTNPRQAIEVLGESAERHAGKAFVATHLSSPRAPATPIPSDVFHVVHTGNFYPPGHTAAALVRGLRLFLDRTPGARTRVRVTQAGWCHGDLPAWAAQCAVGDVVHVTGRLNQLAVTRLLDEASLLVAIDYSRADSRTMLSKLPDYIAARRPILAITSPTSAVARLFDGDGAGLTAHYDSPPQVAARIGEVFEAWRHGGVDAYLPSQTAVESFSCGRVLNELAGAFYVAQRRSGAALDAVCSSHLEPNREVVAS